MGNAAANKEQLFEILTPLGFTVRVTRQYWLTITTLKHPVMAGCEEALKEALSNPDEIRLSRRAAAVYLFYKQERERRWVCAVSKRLVGEGFLITAYLTGAIKEGDRIWPK